MLKLLIKVVKKVIISVFMLYGLNLLLSSMNILIPINIISIIMVSVLGIPGVCSLVVLFLLV